MSRAQEADALIRDRRENVFIELPAVKGSIPVLAVSATSLAEAWELSLLALYGHGCEIRTEYDRKNGSGEYIDPPSLDCTMRMVVKAPDSEPFIHRCFPGGLEDLEEYRQEVMEGIKDHWCRDPRDPEDNRWEYTYHQRIFNYTVPGREQSINQMDNIVEGLCNSPYSRRQQAVVWKVWEDMGIDDPACMQSLWFRILEDEQGVWRLNLNVRFRSRDAYDAAYMNCFALVHLMREVAEKVALRSGRNVSLGRYVDESDSYHIYGHKLEDFQNRFMRQVERRSLDDRTWTMEFAGDIFEEARPGIRAKIEQHDRGKKR